MALLTCVADKREHGSEGAAAALANGTEPATASKPATHIEYLPKRAIEINLLRLIRDLLSGAGNVRDSIPPGLFCVKEKRPASC
jgi:hypothetical protein